MYKKYVKIIKKSIERNYAFIYKHFQISQFIISIAHTHVLYRIV